MFTVSVPILPSKVAVHEFLQAFYLLQMKKIEDARKIYERLVTQFPNAGRYWKIYIEHEVNMSIHYFSKCKKTVCFLYVLPYLHTTWNGLVTQWYRIITACNGISFLKYCFVQFYYEITRAFTFEIIRISRVYIANTCIKSIQPLA